MSKPPHLALAILILGACTEAPRSVVDHGDGTYSFAALDGRGTSTTERQGALTWSYVGQTRHSDEIKPMTKMEYIVGTAGDRTDERKLLDLVRRDADGSQWRVTGVDTSVTSDQLARHAASSTEVARGLTVEAPGYVRPVEAVGERRSITPFSWTVGSCGNAYYMGDDDRVLVSATSNSRRKAQVEIRAVQPGVSCPYGGDYVACLQDGQSIDYCKMHVLNCHGSSSYTYTQCSGVILRDQWVLTAAHCGFDASSNSIPASRLKIRRWDGVTTAELGVASIFMDAQFSNNDLFDPSNDWMLLKLAAPLAAPYSDMDISNASDTTLNNLGGAVSNLGFPAYAPSCSDNRGGDNYVDALWSNTAGELGAVYSEKVNLKFDSGPGESGSPFFYCPDGADDDCTGDELGHVVALTTGWDGVITSVVGAKGPAFYSTATTTMDNN